MEEKLKKLKREHDKAMEDLAQYLQNFEEMGRADFFFDYMTGRIAGLRYAISVLEGLR
jgi:hypothetical protein